MNSVSYDKTSCTRCGGSGHFSYNQRTGTTCFKCGGSGTQLTKRGSAAKEFADSLLDVKIQHVPEGGKFTYIDAFAGKGYKFCTAEANGDTGLKVNGKVVETFDILSSTGKHLCRAGAGIRVRLQPTTEQIQQINDYQDSLTKAGKPSKRKA